MLASVAMDLQSPTILPKQARTIEIRWWITIGDWVQDWKCEWTIGLLESLDGSEFGTALISFFIQSYLLLLKKILKSENQEYFLNFFSKTFNSSFQDRYFPNSIMVVQNNLS